MSNHLARVAVSLIAILAFTATGAEQPTNTPTWWQDYGIKFEGSTDSDLGSKQSAKGKAVTLGQLKDWAAGARDYLDSTLATEGGAGQLVKDGIASLEAGDPSAVASQQQFQTVLQPIYDRLIAAGYDTKASLAAHGAGADWASDYPWADAPTGLDGVALDLAAYAAWQLQQAAPADVTQAKLALSFDLSDSSLKVNFLRDRLGLGGKGKGGSGADEGSAKSGDEADGTAGKNGSANTLAGTLATTLASEDNHPALALVVLTPLE